MKRKLIIGIELSSYLQMLASDKQTCMLRLQGQGRMGVLCMRNGALLDAQARMRNDSGGSSLYREEAVIEMLRWKWPEIEFLPLDKPIKKRIAKSLEFLLLESCRFQDEAEVDELEGAEDGDLKELANFSGDMPFHSMPMFIGQLTQNRHVVAYLVLDLQGNIVVKDDEKNILDADFLSFIQFTLNSYNPEILPDNTLGHNISFVLNNNRTIMIYALKSNVLGLVVDSQVACEEVEKDVIPLLSYLQASEPNMVMSVSS